MTVNAEYFKKDSVSVVVNNVMLNPKIRRKGEAVEVIYPWLTKSLWTIRCLQCNAEFTGLIYMGSSGQTMVVLPSINGGLSTPNTPDSVAFYLDQASKAKSVGANSAGVAMFRGALEHILFHQGYKMSLLDAKIKALVKDVEEGVGPTWAKEIDATFLTVIKELGNGAIHPNDGDVDKQRVLDTGLINQLDVVFSLLLYIIYEAPSKKEALMTSLQAKALTLRK